MPTTDTNKIQPISIRPQPTNLQREDVFAAMHGVDDLLADSLTVCGQASDDELARIATAMQNAALLLRDYLTVRGINQRLLRGGTYVA